MLPAEQGLFAYYCAGFVALVHLYPVCFTGGDRQHLPFNAVSMLQPEIERIRMVLEIVPFLIRDDPVEREVTITKTDIRSRILAYYRYLVGGNFYRVGRRSN